MSTKIKYNGEWKDVNTNRSLGKVFQYSFSSAAVTNTGVTTRTYTISGLPTGKYLYKVPVTPNAATPPNVNNILITKLNNNSAKCFYSMCGGTYPAFDHDLTFFNHTNDDDDITLTIELYNNTNCSWQAGSFGLYFVRVA